MPNWIWYGAPKYQYRPEGSRRFLAQSEVQEWSKKSAESATTHTQSLAVTLGEDQITLGKWQREMRGAIKEEFSQQYFLGRGGRAQMTPKDWGSLGGMLNRQYRYLDNFAADIEAGKLTVKQIAARAAMYMNAARQAFERAAAAARGVDFGALPVYPTEDCLGLTNCGCNWVWRRRGSEWHVTWTLGATDHCEVCLGHASEWNPYVIPIDAKSGRFVTIDGRPVFVGGPGQGGGGTGGGSSTQVIEGIFSEWKDGLSSDELHAIQKYADSKYAIVNAHLRELDGFGEDDLTERNLEVINTITSGLDSALEKSQVPSDVTTLRRMGVIDTSGWEAGDEFVDQGYLSTSLSQSYIESGARGGKVATVLVPRGTNAAFIGFSDDSLGFPEEAELLLARGLKYRVVKNDQSGLELEVVP